MLVGVDLPSVLGLLGTHRTKIETFLTEHSVLKYFRALWALGELAGRVA